LNSLFCWENNQSELKLQKKFYTKMAQRRKRIRHADTQSGANFEEITGSNYPQTFEENKRTSFDEITGKRAEKDEITG
jgi:hypothetical protein